LAGEAFDYAWQKAVERRLEGVDEAADAVERLKKMIDNFVDIRTGLVAGGCPLMNTAVEADDGNPMLRARARGALSGWMARLGKVAEEGIARREIQSRVDCKALSQIIISTLEGALLISRLENDRASLDQVRRHLQEYLETNVRLRKKAAKRGV
jgi:TetR/AcrR family transcriptional repressor of nem operon